MSRARRLVNKEGRRRMFCPRCEREMGTVSFESGCHTALCVVCRMADEGKTVPQDVVDQLYGCTPSIAGYYEPLLDKHVTDEDLAQIPPVRTMFRTLRSRIVNATRVLVGKDPKPVLESTKIAHGKKRKRVFDLPIDEVSDE